MSLSRHFQFVLSQNEAAAISRVSYRREPPPHPSVLGCSDLAHLRNVLDRLHEAYEAAAPAQPQVVEKE